MSEQAHPLNVPQFEMRHRLDLALEHAGIGVGEMADVLGVNRNTVGNYLAGRTRPSKSAIAMWAMRCGVDVGWLRDGIEPTGGTDGTPVTPRYLRHATRLRAA